MKKKDTKEDDLLYISQFREISLINVCRDLNIDYYNVIKGKASATKIKKVRKEIERRLKIIKEDKYEEEN